MVADNAVGTEPVDDIVLSRQGFGTTLSLDFTVTTGVA